jgi:4-hydroxy-2-oxoheptanedioate aldolase
MSGEVVVAADKENAASKETTYTHLNKIIAKLERDILVTGIWVSALHPSNAIGLVELNGFPNYEESLTKPMIDFIVIDMEHEPFEMTELRNFLLALNSKREVLIKGNLQPNIATLVRIPADGNQPVHFMIKQVLDIGVHGVVVPHVRTARDAEKVVKACRYVQPKGSEIAEPGGTRGASPWLCAYLWGLTMEEYVQRADLWPLNPKGDLLAIIMIEDEEGVRNIDKILSIKGIGAVIFGPYDFSFSCGLYGRVDHPDVIKNWNRVKRACDRFNIPLIGLRNIDEKLKEDYKMLLIGGDVAHDGSIKTVLDLIRKGK